MKETRFIDQNREKWEALESMLQSKSRDPDTLGDLFIQVSDDLSYARSHYPNRVVRLYLNQLSSKVYGNLLRNTSRHGKALLDFFRIQLPIALFKARREIVWSLLLFALAFGVGVLSSHYEPGFARSILGSSYLNVTDQNIAKGDPMAIYKDKDILPMFVMIAQNNIFIAIRTFLFGLLLSVGSMGVMLVNGVMVGVFQYYFIQKGLFWDSALSIWMHGTFEISAIILSGAAGLVLGRGLVFPGSYTRMQSLRISARQGIRIMVLAVFMLLVAAVIESAITRLTMVHDGVRGGLILSMATAVVLYTWWYPKRVARRFPERVSGDVVLQDSRISLPEPDAIKSSGTLFGESFQLFFRFVPKVLPFILISSLLIAVLMVFYLIDPASNPMLFRSPWHQIFGTVFFITKIATWLHATGSMAGPVLIALQCAGTAFILLRCWERDFQGSVKSGWWSAEAGMVLLLQLPMMASLYLAESFSWMFMAVLPVQLFGVFSLSLRESGSIGQRLKTGWTYLRSDFGNFTGIMLILGLMSLGMAWLSDISPELLNAEVLELFFYWSPENYQLYKSTSTFFFHFSGLMLAYTLLSCGAALSVYSHREKVTAGHLRKTLIENHLYED